MDMSKMTVPVLKNHLISRGLSVQGRRAELVQRLEDDIAAKAATPATVTTLKEIDNLDKLAEFIQTEVARVELPAECITIQHTDGQLVTLSPVATLLYNFNWTFLREIQTAIRKKLPNRAGGRPNMSGNVRPASKRQAFASPLSPHAPGLCFPMYLPMRSTTAMPCCAQLLDTALRCVCKEDLVAAATKIEALDFSKPTVVAAASCKQFVIEGILDKITPVVERKKKGADADEQ